MARTQGAGHVVSPAVTSRRRRSPALHVIDPRRFRWVFAQVTFRAPVVERARTCDDRRPGATTSAAPVTPRTVTRTGFGSSPVVIATRDGRFVAFV
jgi:hypothetical protein